MSRTVRVDLGERGYDIRIGRDLTLADALPGASGRALVVSDSNVGPLYAGRCGEQIRAAGWESTVVTVPAGESTKCLAQLELLYRAAVAAGLDRHSILVALGGGVVGDLTGFAAATFLRGIGFLQVPTSLLAMVDSSVGGKTGVDLPEGKNLVGAFHQPLGVSVDLTTLATLPAREYLSGLAEVIKYGVIWDAAFFGRLESEADRIRLRDADVLEQVVARCCEIKAEVVGMDERESGVRAILNFGHTFGHALEQAAGYRGWLHGEAVAVGMVYAAELSVRARRFPRSALDRLVALLRRFGLPVNGGERGARPPWTALREAMSADKKSRQRVPRWVLAERLGCVAFGCEVEEAGLRATWEALQALPGGSSCQP